MIQLAPEELSEELQVVLNSLQDLINKEGSFANKVAKAQSLWKSKGGAKGKKAFLEISSRLYDLCTYVGVCNYCEQSEANDIEHISPKSFFPEKTFAWGNYILACKQCNSGFKLDKCFVLDEENEIIEVKRGNEPPYKTLAFINPVFENPNNFMILNLLSCKFELIPDLDKQSIQKAETTLSILELNQRDTLLAARKSAGRYYYEMLNRLRLILSTTSIEELIEVLTPYDNMFDFEQPLEQIKDQIKNSYKAHIRKYQHPSVWYSIKMVSSRTDSKWVRLFNDLPEILTW